MEKKESSSSKALDDHDPVRTNPSKVWRVMSLFRSYHGHSAMMMMMMCIMMMTTMMMTMMMTIM